MITKEAKLITFLKNNGGIAKYVDIIKAGISKTILKKTLNSGIIQKIDRGLYRLSKGTTLSNPDIIAALTKIPKGVVCLLSALAFHEVTNEIPHSVDVAIEQGAHANKIMYPPVKFYRFAPAAWEAGIETYKVEGHKIRVYNLAKTIADCFKFRNRIGIDVARDALKIAVNEKKSSPQEIMRYAKICRVDNIIKPILETIL